MFNKQYSNRESLQTGGFLLLFLIVIYQLLVVDEPAFTFSITAFLPKGLCHPDQPGLVQQRI